MIKARDLRFKIPDRRKLLEEEIIISVLQRGL